MKFSAFLFKKDLLNFLLSKYKNFQLRIHSLFFLPVIFESYLDFSLLCVPSSSLCVHKAKSMWDHAIHMCFKCLQTEFSVPKSNCVVQYWLCSLCSTSPEFRLVQVWFLACPCAEWSTVLKFWDIWPYFSMKWSMRGVLLCNLRLMPVFCYSRCFELFFFKIVQLL